MKNIYTALCLFAVVALSSTKAFSQDMHFSHYFMNMSPMQQNPATAGAFDGDWRAGLNYRNQWQSVTAPWRTFDAYGDLGFMKNPTKPFYLGAGLFIMRDVAGDGDLGVTKVMANGAFHFKIKNLEQHTLSGGLQLGYVRKSIDWNKLYFHNQWNDASFDQGLPSFEQYSGSSLGYVDAAFGVVYRNQTNDRYNYYASGALHHLLGSKETFYDGGTNKLGMRPVIGAGVGVSVTTKLSVSPSFNYMSQKKASELLLGIMAGYDITGESAKKMVVYGGVYTRMKDAFYPAIGMDYGPWRGFVSYDVNTSELQPASGSRGGIELSLQYVGGVMPKPQIMMMCPRY